MIGLNGPFDPMLRFGTAVFPYQSPNQSMSTRHRIIASHIITDERNK
uniref:Uncharacterized protein n=1 Tax=Arundo donax TaxID=35708 RepID=A0A0A9F8C7_ARUDO